MSLTKFVGLLAFTAVAGTAAAASVEATNDTNAQIAELKKELSELKSQNGDKWLTEERASQIRGVVQDVMADADTRSSLQATAATSGYNNGFFIASPDGNFKLQVNGQVQVRYAYSRLSNAGWTTTVPQPNQTRVAKGFEIRRAKLNFSGNVVDPSWTYKMTLAYLPAQNNANGSPYNVSESTVASGNGNGTSSTANLEDAYINKDFGNGWGLMMGQFKSPFLHEELVSSKNQLAVERSIVNQLFSTGWTDGVMLTGKNDNLMGMISFNNGGNNANFATANSSTTGGTGGFTQYAFTGRLQWLAFGNWNQFNDMTSMRGDAQGLMLGAGFNWQHGGVQTNPLPTGGGSNTDSGYFSYCVDASWDLGGANLYGAFVGNFTSSLPGLGGAFAGGNGSAIQSYGAIVQGGYFITDTMELFGRFEWYETASQGGNNPAVAFQSPLAAQQNIIITGGLNWYLNKNVKFTFDTGWSNNGILFTGGLYGSSVAGTNYQTSNSINAGGEWVFRGQMQLVF
ncbi:MAG: OprO/OprP family phosphate-selective porin [Planctomycetes bacterium]|nr:OprO/OprP family phosphate-selective porin [Planctomycetota bacterium]